MDEKREQNIGANATVTQRRSERKAKRKALSTSAVDIEIKSKTKKNVRKPPSSEKSTEKPFRDPPKKVKTEQPTSGNSHKEPRNKDERDLPAKEKIKKKKKTTYEIDCARINLNAADFQKDLWRRAKDGKFKSVKNMRMKLSGNTIYITTRSYVPKKCIRSNVYFLAKAYLKKSNIDRPIRIIGDNNVYQLVYK